MATSWVNLLRKSGVEPPRSPTKPVRQPSREGLGRRVTVSERTPQARVGAKRSGRLKENGSVQVLRSQIASLLKENRELTDKAADEHTRLVRTESELERTRSELGVATKMDHQQLVGNFLTHAPSPSWQTLHAPSPSRQTLHLHSCSQHSQFDTTPSSEELDTQVHGLQDALDQVTREKRVLLGELGRERERGEEEGRRVSEMEERLGHSNAANLELEKSLHEREEQVEGLMAHVKDLRSEITRLTGRMTSHPTHNNNTLVKDLECLCLRNAELSNNLAATRHSRTLLEREVVSLKRSLHESRSCQAQLEEELAEVRREKEVLAERVAGNEGEGRRRLREMQRQLDSVLSDSGRLEGTLTSISSEKELLATSLRQEANYNKQLEEEKETLELHLHDTQQCLETTQAELQRLKDSQVSEIDVKCREIDGMKLQLQQELGGLAEEREGLEVELREAREDLRRTRAENERLCSNCASLRDSLSASERRRSELEGEVEEGRRRCECMEREVEEGRRRRERMEREVEEGRRRCERMEREARVAAEVAESRVKQQVDNLKSHVEHSAQHLQHVEGENRTLHERLGRVESQLSQERSEYCAATDRLHGNLQRVTADFDSTLSELEGTRTTNMLQEQQVSDLEAQVSGLQGQLDSRAELLQEMKALLDQRASRIRQLERSVERGRRDTSDVHNLSRSTQESSLLEASSLPSLDCPSPSTLTPPHLSTSRLSLVASPVRFSSPTAESFHLKQRLADSRQACVRLEVQQASLKTEVAKLQGSLQALTTIREHLTEENGSLREANQRLEEEGAVCDREKEVMGRELIQTREALEGRESEVSELRSEVNELKNTNEELHNKQLEMQATAVELESLCWRKDQELSGLRQASLAAREEVQRELMDVQREVEEWREEAARLQQTMDAESGLLREDTLRCGRDVSTLRAEAIDVQESNRITDAVNVTRERQIHEREARVSSLLGEVEVMRARKAVMLRFLAERERGERDAWEMERERMGREIRTLQGELDQLRGEGMLSEVQAALMEALREKDQLKLQLTRFELTACLSEPLHVLTTRADPPSQAANVDPLSQAANVDPPSQAANVDPPSPAANVDPPSRAANVDRLRNKLKLQVRQTNYLRLRLAYAISELRLYKRVKSELDVRLEELQQGLLSSQQQYGQCLVRLQAAERLGFAGH